MISFTNDYSEVGHPRVLADLKDYGTRQFAGYGEDEITEQAVALIRQRVGREDIDVHFIDGGTHANLTVIAAALRPHHAVVAAESAHIATHETGAIEATGHKVLTVPGEDGRISAAELREVYRLHHFDQMVKPRLLYISETTEFGTVYSKEQLKDLYEAAHDLDMLVYIDGARMGAALAHCGDALTLADVAAYSDAFTIGGTKNGALFGEAVILIHDDLKRDFRFLMRQRGALMAKGYLVSSQFVSLLRDKLFIKLAESANADAERLRRAFAACGCKFESSSPTNQLFPIVPRAWLAELQKDFEFKVWTDDGGDMVTLRFITSWATPEEHLQALENALAPHKLK